MGDRAGIGPDPHRVALAVTDSRRAIAWGSISFSERRICLFFYVSNLESAAVRLVGRPAYAHALSYLLDAAATARGESCGMPGRQAPQPRFARQRATDATGRLPAGPHRPPRHHHDLHHHLRAADHLSRVISALQLQQRAEEQAMLGARHVEVQLTQQERIDRLNQVSINVLHATRSAQQRRRRQLGHRQRRHDADVPGQGRVVAGDARPASRSARRSSRGISISPSARARSSSARSMSPPASCCWALPPTTASAACRWRGWTRRSNCCDAKQSELLSQKHQLEMQNLRFDAALNNMSQGLCMCDGEHKLVVCNAPYARMYGLPPELAQPGTPFAEIITHRLATGLHVEQSPDDYMRDLREHHRRAQAGDQDPRAQRRARHRHQASADAGRRLARPRTRT